MLSAGGASGMLGYTMGLAALKSVSQPDTRPTNKLVADKSASTGKEGVTIMKEEEILKKVKDHIKTQAQASAKNKKSSSSKK